MAVARVKRALETGERIAVFGDYDVDGSVSAALLADFLAALGVAAARLYSRPHDAKAMARRPPAMQTLQAEGASLVVTVDCGAAGGAAFEAARDAGLDVVVLDHHRVETRPDALAHVNPNQPGDHIRPHLSLCRRRDVPVHGALNRALRDSGLYARTRHRRTGSARASRSGGAGHGLRCGAAHRRQPRLCAPGAGATCQAGAPRSGGAGGGGQSRAAFHALSSGFRLRSAHQCRRAGGPLAAWAPIF